MNLSQQIEAAKRIRDFIMREAPQDKEGELLGPYKGWIGELDRWIKKGESWMKNVAGSKR